MTTRYFGIRHHGPGSSKSLLRALNRFQPELILIEGPPDANALLTLTSDPQMRPPVALLVYPQDAPQEAVFYPFAHFSPEWQALLYANTQACAAQFMDLPRNLCFQAGETHAEERLLRHDPIIYLAKAAGYEEGERWWEDLVEQRQDADEIFEAIFEMMLALRAHFPETQAYHLLRESAMRLAIREAQKQYDKIAVVCGAWHLPALQAGAFDLAADQKALSALKQRAVSVSWIPWTYERLSLESGYGAGVPAPGWYAHLFDYPENTLEIWFARVGQALRDLGHDVSSAHLIEATRLSFALSALRDKNPGLAELNEAAVSVLCHGQEQRLQLLKPGLMVGQQMGQIPESAPMTPLQTDFYDNCKQLRLKAESQSRELPLDLRKKPDFEKSLFLHRLTLLQIQWGRILKESGKLGTFNERWALQWRPENEIQLIEASVYGNTITEATVKACLQRLQAQPKINELCTLLEQCMFAELPELMAPLLNKLQALSSGQAEIEDLIQALPPLIQVQKYGNVRETDVSLVAPLVEKLILHICIALKNYVLNLNPQAAETALIQLQNFQQSLIALNQVTFLNRWYQELRALIEMNTVPSLIRGYACRQLFEAERLSENELQQGVAFALSNANVMSEASQWLEGLLQGGGLLLIHHPRIFFEIDRWLSALKETQFKIVLPILRRSFSRFSAAERRQMGNLLRKPIHNETENQQLDPQRLQAVLPLLSHLYGGVSM